MNCSNDKTKIINGCLIRYREAGKGPLLFLVHGIAGFWKNGNLQWKFFLKNIVS